MMTPLAYMSMDRTKQGKYSTFDIRVRAVKAVLRGLPLGDVAEAYGVHRTTLFRRVTCHGLQMGKSCCLIGTRLICSTPHVAPDAWLHVLFPPLANGKIEIIERGLEWDLPKDFKDFLLRANGLMLFSYHISVWGQRETMARTGEDAWQPHDLVAHNFTTERPVGSPNNIGFFGSSNQGDCWCFFEFEAKNYRVGKTARDAFHPVSY
jgi:hypothetical protein